VTRDQLEAAVLTSPTLRGRCSQYKRVHGIEDYLHVRGDLMSARQAALRLGVSQRTVTRWRAVLREVT
jgi:predicted DNA-binding transcriptional regulator YafY